MYIPDRASVPHVCLRVHLPPDYPSSSAPLPEIDGPHLSNDVKVWVVAELEGQFAPGTYAAYTPAASAYVHLSLSQAQAAFIRCCSVGLMQAGTGNYTIVKASMCRLLMSCDNLGMIPCLSK